MKAQDIFLRITRPAAAAVSTSFLFGVINSSDQIAVAGAGVGVDCVIETACDAAGDQITGYIAPAWGYVRAGAAFANGAELMSNASGKAVAATATNQVVAIAQEAATAVDQLVLVKFLARAQYTET